MVDTKQQTLEDIHYTLKAIILRSGKAGRDSNEPDKTDTIKAITYTRYERR